MRSTAFNEIGLLLTLLLTTNQTRTVPPFPAVSARGQYRRHTVSGWLGVRCGKNLVKPSRPAVPTPNHASVQVGAEWPAISNAKVCSGQVAPPHQGLYGR
ncbi:hypothetical protein [Streptomyces sp. NPDC039028]|uniref:hypothetical protein n=1 Tax=unclassified Streptomyces TaxID=2593676 RepID=UPI0033E885A3